MVGEGDEGFMSKVWLTSDWHFCHNQPFLYEPRGFKNVEEMNEVIIAKHNSIVMPEDDVIVLGDLMLNDNAKGIECINRLNGNLHIVAGNHDTANRIQEYVNLKAGTEFWGYAVPYKYRKYNFYLSHYPTLTSNLDVDKPLKARVISLCGHNHTQDRWIDWDKGLIYHVEMDAHNCYPVLLDDIIEEIKNHITERSI